MDSNVATVTITVNSVNDPPVVTAPANQTNSQGDIITLQIQASDPDGDALSYSGTGLAAGLAINASTGLIFGAISFGASAGSPNSVAITASDGNGRSASIHFSWTVIAGITFRSAAFARTGKAAALTIPKPTGIVPGNLMLASIEAHGGAIVGAPVGWAPVLSNSSGAILKQATYYRIAGSSEPASYTWTFSSAQVAVGGIAVYGGVDHLNPIDVANGQNNPSSTLITAPSVTTTVADTMLIGIFGIEVNTSIRPPTGMVERGETSVTTGKDRVSIEFCEVIQTVAGTTGARVATADTAASNIGQLIALKPLAAPPTTPPPAPTNLLATPDDTRVALSWSASPSASSYNVKRSSVSGGPYTPIASVTSISYLDGSLINGVTYYYIVSASNSVGEGPDSTPVSATPHASPPAAPSNLTATEVSANQINLSWKDNSNNEDGFAIERSTNQINFTQIATTGPNVSTYSNTGLARNTQYYYRVRAYGGSGVSAYSNTASARTRNK